MEDKKIVALSDDALDEVAGGLIINDGIVVDQETGTYYQLLGNKWEAFSIVNQLGPANDAQKLEALRNAGMLGNPYN